MTVSAVRLLAISLALAIAPPAVPALAGWRDGPYYADDGWGGDYYPPARAYRPGPAYRDEYQPDYGYDQRPWAGRRQAYAPYYDEPYYYGPDGRGPAVRPRVIRPPRNVAVMPGQPRRLAPVKPKTLVGVPPAVKPAPVQEATALPVPRPNLEIMDFDAATPAVPAPTALAPADK